MQQILKIWLQGETQPIYTRVEGKTPDEAIRSLMDTVVTSDYFTIYDTDGKEIGMISTLVTMVQAT